MQPALSLLRRSCALTVLLGAFASVSANGDFPMPRDATIAELISAYSEKSCTARILEGLKITEPQCVARIQAAKQNCPVLIAVGLPEKIDERQLGMLVARSAGCNLRFIMDKPYDNAPWDKSAADMLQQHGN